MEWTEIIMKVPSAQLEQAADMADSILTVLILEIFSEIFLVAEEAEVPEITAP